MSLIRNTKSTIEIPIAMIRDDRLTIYAMGVFMWLHNFETLLEAETAWINGGNDPERLHSALGELARADYLADGVF